MCLLLIVFRPASPFDIKLFVIYWALKATADIT